MNQEELSKKLLSPSKNSRLEKLGKGLTFACLSLIVIICGYDFNLCSPKRFVDLLCQWCEISLIFSLVQLGIHQVSNLVPFQ